MVLHMQCQTLMMNRILTLRTLRSQTAQTLPEKNASKEHLLLMGLKRR